LRLLVVDDDEAWRDVLNLLFDGRPDILVAQAVSGTDAIEKVQAGDYDLLLLDMRMPSGTEGLDVLLEIKKLKPQTQVVMMSAYGDIPKTVEAMRRGAARLISSRRKQTSKMSSPSRSTSSSVLFTSLRIVNY